MAESNLIDGRLVSTTLRAKLKEEIKNFDPKPYLVTILVGDNEGSKVYINIKEKACADIGLKNTVYRLPASSSQEEIENKIQELNEDPTVNGILLQLPLPKPLDGVHATMKISPEKDVDGLHYINMGKLFAGFEGFIPCTPAGIMELLKYYKVNLEGKHTVIIGRSNLVGKPLVRLFERENSTVTLCHSRTKNLKELCLMADVLVAAVGRAKIITSDMVKEGAIVIDVGTNRVEGKLVGDVDFDNVKQKAGLITPNPGGVGPMTVTMLLSNTVKSYKIKHGIE